MANLYELPGSVAVQDLRGGVFGIDLFDDALQDAGFVKDERAPERADGGFAVHFLLPDGPEGLVHLPAGVGQERKRKPVLGAEAGMGGGAVLAHANDVVSGGGEGRVIVPDAAGLGRAPGGVVLGIKVNDGLFAFFDEILGPHGMAVLVQHLEGWHFVSDFKHMR